MYEKYYIDILVSLLITFKLFNVYFNSIRFSDAGDAGTSKMNEEEETESEEEQESESEVSEDEESWKMKETLKSVF